jgi:uncharacterized protein YegL
MKKGSAYIGIVLDRSGSMHDIRSATVAGLNEFIAEQKLVPGLDDTRVKLVRFDSEYESVFDKPLSEVETFDDSILVPRGMTALHDAIGRTVTEMGKELEAMSESQRPEKVFVMIVTDGEENSSAAFSGADVANLVKQQTDVYKWKFIFLGANQDAITNASKLNIAPGSTISYNASSIGTQNVFKSTASAMCSFRSMDSSESWMDTAKAFYSEDDRTKAMEDDDK